MIWFLPPCGPYPPGAGPWPDHTQTNRTPSADEGRELDTLASVLLDFALDVAGLFDPTPFTDTVSALRALAAGRWLDAALSSVAAAVPFVGDLAKAGKLPRYVRALEKAMALAERSGQAMRLVPGVKKLVQVLEWLPTQSNELLHQARLAGRAFLHRHTGKVQKKLPDISERFTFATEETAGYYRRIARGRLGHPDKIRRDLRRGAQKTSKGTGEDASHLIGRRFGGPSIKENLSLQNRRMNQGHDWKKTEDYWERQLRAGVGIEVEVIDVYRRGETRPYTRKASWIEIHPDGRRVHQQIGADIGNWDSPARREATKARSLHEGEVP